MFDPRSDTHAPENKTVAPRQKVDFPPLSRRPIFLCYDKDFVANNRKYPAGVYFHEQSGGIDTSPPPPELHPGAKARTGGPIFRDAGSDLVTIGIPPGSAADHVALTQVDLTQAAKLGGQPGFQANATHLELAYRVHRILVAAGKGELAIPHGVDREAVRRFVDEVFFATQFLAEDLHAEAKARAKTPTPRLARPPRAFGSLLRPQIA